MSDKILRNICLVIFVAQCICVVRYVIDMLLGGDTEWWQPVLAGFIAAALLVLFNKYREKVKNSR